MNHPTKPIEKVFLESILKMSLISILAVIVVDIFFAGTVIRSIIVNSTVLFAIVISYAFYHRGYFTSAVLLIGFLIMAAMFYQSIIAEAITTSSMAVVMIIGFGFSILLKGKLPWFLHGITLLGMTVVFSWLALHPARYGQPNANNIIIAGFTYQILYSLIAYSSKFLKQRYDEAIASLALINNELIEKSNEIETQNEELVQSQENLSQLNNHLESMVQERTLEVQRQNEQLIKYAYSNAHHVRGPVARVLGLIQLSKMETNLDYPFLFKKIEEQANEIDEVVSRINKELE
jgi:hypothetical protein